jgi:hypothetical protein
LRVTRRFGAASGAESPAGGVAASELGSAAAAFVRVDARRFGAGASVAASETALAPAVAFVRVDVRRFGAASDEPVGAAEMSPVSSSAATEES